MESAAKSDLTADCPCLVETLRLPSKARSRNSGKTRGPLRATTYRSNTVLHRRPPHIVLRVQVRQRQVSLWKASNAVTEVGATCVYQWKTLLSTSLIGFSTLHALRHPLHFATALEPRSISFRKEI